MTRASSIPTPKRTRRQAQDLEVVGPAQASNSRRHRQCRRVGPTALLEVLNWKEAEWQQLEWNDGRASSSPILEERC